MTDWWNDFEEPLKKRDFFKFVCKNYVKCDNLLICHHKELHEFDDKICVLKEGEKCASGFEDSECIPVTNNE